MEYTDYSIYFFINSHILKSKLSKQLNKTKQPLLSLTNYRIYGFISSIKSIYKFISSSLRNSIILLITLEAY